MTPRRDINRTRKGSTKVSRNNNEIYGLEEIDRDAMALCRIGFASDAATRIRTKPSKRYQQHGSTTKACTKRAFRNRDQVKEAITRNRYARTRQEIDGGTSNRLENRYWFCTKCLAYHLTSKPLYTTQGGTSNVA